MGHRFQIIILIVVLIITMNISAEWEWRFPLPQGEDLDRVIVIETGDVLLLSEMNRTLLFKECDHWERIDTGLSRRVKNVYGFSKDDLFAYAKRF